MRLHELLAFDDIVIQCHDNPDADALASGYALLWYLKQNEKRARFIYRGQNKIRKSNLLIMLEKLAVPVTYAPEFSEVPELLVTVDCQYGMRNVTRTEAKTVAVIDHHQDGGNLPALSEVRSQLGSCATVLWDMIRSEGFDFSEDPLLSTAVYYGLFTDTNRFSEVSHPLDRDLIDTLPHMKSLITEMSNSNISLSELKITGKAILGYRFFEKYRCLFLQAEPCDPNIVGMISDFALETAEVDVCFGFYESPGEIKFSVRSCVREVHADELAAFLSEGVGGGGGHMYKAGGTVRPEKLAPFGEAADFFKRRLEEYFERYEILYAKETLLDTSDMKCYEKLPQNLGFVRLPRLFPTGSTVEIRTLEGDVDVKIAEDTCMMIGVEGEVYPILEKKLLQSYRLSDKPYSRDFSYEPVVKNIETGEKKKVLAYAESCTSVGTTKILAKRLDRYVKLFTAWDEEKYYAGKPGDYIAVREDDPHDIYIIKDRLFPVLYREV